MFVFASHVLQGSFIHVDDFRSPAELGQYLKYLDGNDTAYSQYFKWRGTGGPEVVTFDVYFLYFFQVNCLMFTQCAGSAVFLIISRTEYYYTDQQETYFNFPFHSVFHLQALQPR